MLLLLPAMLVSCGSVFQGPILGQIELENASDAADAVVFLRCRGPGIHGDIRTDAEETRVRADGSFLFLGSLTFPTTEHCYLELRHPRYLTMQTQLEDRLVQKPAAMVPRSWEAFLDTGPTYQTHPSAHGRWPEYEVYRHMVDTVMWLRTFPQREWSGFARYIPDIHNIYRRAFAALGPGNDSLPKYLKNIALLEELTAYPYPFRTYLDAINNGDADTVRAFIAGGVLRETQTRNRHPMLYVAAAGGHLEVIDVLLANGEPLQAGGCEATLLGALGKQQWQAALHLLRAGASTDVSCNERRPLGDALTYFTRRGELEMLASFLDAGVPVDLPNSRGTTALAEAVEIGRIQSVRSLLAAGASAEARSAQDLSLADDAAARGFLDVERELRHAISGSDSTAAADPWAGEPIALPWRRGATVPPTAQIAYSWVLQIVPDPATPDLLWLATDGGLLRIAPTTGEQRTWTRDHGLPTSSVRDLWFDSSGGYLWVSTSGGLARLPLDAMDQVETVGSGKPHSSYSSSFLGSGEDGAVWFLGSDGLYRLQAERGLAHRFTLQQAAFDAMAIPGGAEFYLATHSSLQRFDTRSGQNVDIVDAAVLARLVPEGPRGLPQIISLTPDRTRDHLWLGTFRHGVFRLDTDSGAISRPFLTADQVAKCSRTTVTPHMHGQVTRAAGQTFVQLERCFGYVDEDNNYHVMRDRIDAGPVADAGGNLWFLAGTRLHRIDPQGTARQFASGRVLR